LLPSYIPNYYKKAILTFSSEPGERLESLKELVYEARQPQLSERQLIPISFFNWSRIRHLQLRGHVMSLYIKSMGTKDVQFETLVLENVISEKQARLGDKSLEHFIAELNGIQQLKIATPPDQLPLEWLKPHGETLKTISIRSAQSSGVTFWMGRFVRPCSISQISSLNASCPNIKSLALDIGITEIIVGSSLPQPFNII
jgi:hypothetical protein